MDALAKDSVVYTNAYTPLPVCAPVRQSMMNGRHPDSFGAYWNYNFIRTPSILPHDTWPVQLSNQGYENTFVGHWHVSPEYGPVEFGYRNVITLDDYRAFAAEKYPDVTYTGGWFGCSNPIPLKDSLTHFLAKNACKEIRKASASGKPWHVWLDITTPHLPCHPSEPYDSMYDPSQIEPWDGFDDLFENKPYIHRQQAINWNIDGEPWENFQQMVANYYGMISQTDDAFGMVINELKACGEYENTVIVVMSDHGDMCGSHHMLDKHYVLYDDIVRVPLLVKVPGYKPYVCDNFVYNCLDLTSSIYSMFDMLPPEELHGTPLPLCADEDTNPRQYVVSSGSGHQFGLYTTRMIRDKKYKYVWNMTDIDEFYDLQTDPGEKVNRIREKKFADIIAKMRVELFNDLKAHEDPYVKETWLHNQLLHGAKQ